MRRRVLLASASALLAGCLDAESTPGETTPGTVTADDTGEMVACSGDVVSVDDPGEAPADLEYELSDPSFPTKSDKELSFDVGVSDPYVAPEDPGALQFGLRNIGSEPLTVLAGGLPPFGMVHAERVDTAERVLLWQSYERDDCFEREGGHWSVCNEQRELDLASCDRVRTEYQVLPSTTENYPADTVPSGPGDYRIEGELQYAIEGVDSGDDPERLPYAVTISLDEPPAE